MIAGYHNLYYTDRSIVSVTAAVTIGKTGPEGIRQNLTKNFKDITGDALGPETVVDQIYQGGNCFLEFVMQEINITQVRLFLAPARATPTPTTVPAYNEVGKVGHMSTTLAGTLFAIPVVGTPADLAHGTTNSNIRKYQGYVVGDMNETLDVSHNVIPVRFMCLPFSDGTNDVWWDWVSAPTLS